MQLYAYDFSEFMGLDVGDDALFHGGDWIAVWRRIDGQTSITNVATDEDD